MSTANRDYEADRDKPRSRRDFERLEDKCERLRAEVKKLKADQSPEPGEHIADVACSRCGAELVIEHGDDPGEVVVIG